jgi:hypothetical protein
LFSALLISGLGLALVTTNSETSSVPVAIVAAWVLFESTHRSHLDEHRRAKVDGKSRFRFTVGSLLLVMLIVPHVGEDAASIVYSCVWKKIRAPTLGPEARFQSPALAGMLVPRRTGDAAHSEPDDCVALVNDGTSLLHAYAAPTETVLCLAFVNPFSFADLRPCPHGGAFCWHYPRLMNERSHPSPESVFIDADVVMLPRDEATPQGVFMRHYYGPDLHARYRQAAQSKFWTLYRRRRVADR